MSSICPEIPDKPLSSGELLAYQKRIINTRLYNGRAVPVCPLNLTNPDAGPRFASAAEYLASKKLQKIRTLETQNTIPIYNVNHLSGQPKYSSNQDYLINKTYYKLKCETDPC